MKMTSADASRGIKDEKDAVQFLMDYLSSREYRLADRQEFEEFLTIQARRWRDLGNLANLGRALRRDDNEEMLRRLRESMTSEETDGRLLVKSSIPILLQNLSHEETASLQAFSNLVFAAYLLHIRPVIEHGGSYNSQTRDTIDTAFIAADIARFHDVRMLLREVSVEVDRLGASSEQIRATHVRGVQQLASQLEQTVQAERERAEKFSALENALKTKLALEEPVKLWDTKTAAHTRSFWTGLLLLVSLVVFLFAALISVSVLFKDQIIELTKINSILVAAILASPLVAFFLVIRIVGRYVTASLALREDARQRRALADMLVRLNAEPALQMDPEAKRIAISALFRAAPGQPIDEPATHPLADLISTKPQS